MEQNPHKNPLPIGESDINKLLLQGFAYVDKTQHVYEIVKLSGKYFLSRPRRFGKTTLVSTLNEVFKGNKELFKDQWIYHSDYTWDTYPVIRIDFNKSSTTDLTNYILDILKNIVVLYKINDLIDFTSSYDSIFRNIILQLHQKHNKRVVILIDEYDKPILDVIDNLEQATLNREILKGFYGVMKGLDEYIQFILLTGVTRFSKVSIFSALNNLNDISMDMKFADICGITQTELEHTYKDHIEELAHAQNLTHTECIDKIKTWYNGFYFTNNKVSVYNPFSTLMLFSRLEFSNYWFATGSPSFLIKLIKQQPFMDIGEFDNFFAIQSDFDSFDVEDLRPTAILFQAGYLTIKSYDREMERYTLTYPNLEIAKSLKESLLSGYSFKKDANSSYLFKIIQAFHNNNIDDLILHLKQIFLNINYDNIQVSKEQHYQNIIYLIFQLLGYRITTEYKTNRGRIDAIIQVPNAVYILEFKLNQTAQIAIDQIHEKRYYDRFTNQNKPVYLIGINFSDEIKNIDDYIIEEVL